MSSTNAASGNFVLSTWGPCSATERPLVPLPVSRPICPVRPNSIASMTPLFPDPFGPEIANVSLSEINVELSNASHFLDMGGFEFDHLRSPPPAGSEKIFTNSSAFSFLLSASRLRSWSIFSASTSSDSASFARNFSRYLLLKRGHMDSEVDLSALSLTVPQCSRAVFQCQLRSGVKWLIAADAKSLAADA